MRHVGVIGLLCLVVACNGSQNHGKHPLVMPKRGAPPAKFRPVAEIAVNDSEDERLVAGGAPELLGAVETYRAGNHQAALARFFEVMRDPLRPALPKNLATLYAAKTLIALGLPHTGWMLLDKIATTPHHPLRVRALPWLGLIASDVDTDAVLESLEGYQLAEREQLTKQKEPLRHRLAYLFGRRAFLKGDAQTVTLLEEVGSDAVDYPKAQFMLGVVKLREQATKDAVATFQRVEEHAARPGVDDGARIRAMAMMARARVLYELGGEDPPKLDEALAVYRTAQSLEAVSGEAHLEAAWALVRLERAEEAKVALTAARSKLRTRHAETDALGVMIQLKMCALDAGQKSLDDAKARHKEILAEIDRIAKTDLSAQIEPALRFGIGNAQPANASQQAIAIAARRTRLNRILRRFKAIRDEKKKADALPLDFKESLAGRMVRDLVEAAVSRTEKAVALHLAAELAELKDITVTHLVDFDKMNVDLATLRASGC